MSDGDIDLQCSLLVKGSNSICTLPRRTMDKLIPFLIMKGSLMLFISYWEQVVQVCYNLLYNVGKSHVYWKDLL